MDKFGNKFGTSFQLKIISCLLTDRIFLQQLYDILKPEMFDSDANEWLVTKTMSHFDFLSVNSYFFCVDDFDAFVIFIFTVHHYICQK